jgi:tetratricopeptide (TPR) repeat protein
MNLSNDAAYREATQLLRDGKAGSAADLIRDWLARNPRDEMGLSILGSSLMKLDRMPEAIAAFEENIAAHPQSFAAWGDLGFAALLSGNMQRAIQAFEKAVSLNPNFYHGWYYLGRLQHEAGDADRAKVSFARADGADPFVHDCRAIQKNIDDSRFAAAEKSARAILSRQRGHPKASLALAHLAASVGAFEEAAEILAIGIENFPCDLALRSALISSLEELGDYLRALDHAHALAALDPASSARWLTIGRIQGHCGHYEEALSAYDKALGLAPGTDGTATGNLQLLRGHILKILGRYDDSVSAYRRSAESVPGNGAAWWGLADLKTHSFSDADVEEIKRVADDASIKPAQRSQAAFALGKAYEDRADYRRAFSSYAEANALRPDVHFKPEDFLEHIEELIQIFTPDLLAHQADRPPTAPTPIFIVGLPRSGSTLIEQILASHSSIEGTMELVNLPNLLRRIRIDGGRRKNAYPRSMAGFSTGELSAYGLRYLDGTAMYRRGKPFFIDKMPTNFDKVGLIHMILPSAVVVDARRHPLDCGFSCFKQHFAGGHHFSYDLENIGHYYNGYVKLMEHWDSVLPGKVLRVQYEQLVERTEEVVKELLVHCRVPFEDSCLRFSENARPVRTASSEQVRQPIYRKGIGHFRNFQEQLQPLARIVHEAP